MFGNQHLLFAIALEALRGMFERDGDALGGETLTNHLRNFRILAHHQTRRHFDLRHLTAEAGEGLRQFATDRAAAEDYQPRRQFAQRPDGVRGVMRDLRQPRNRRHERPGAGGDDDAARRQLLAAAVFSSDLDRPGRNDFRRTGDDLDAKFGVPRHRVMRRDIGDHPLHPLHDLSK